MTDKCDRCDTMAGIVCFATIMVVALAIGLTVSQCGWKKNAIEHGAARYNEKTGNFEWIKPEVGGE